MPAERAMDKLRLELESRFGKANATLIMISTANQAKVPLASPHPTDFERFVEHLGQHPKVVSHWGDQVHEEVAYWRTLLN
jgi:hypothetical protein